MCLLSVCIPTYKRSATLRRCIESVSNQIEKYNLADAVDIYVANDASPDDTADVLHSYESLSFFTGITRDRNLGMNMNIKTMFRDIKGASEYQLLITDDDYLQPSTLGDIVKFLRKLQGDNNSLSAIWTPRYSYTEDGELHCVVCNPFKVNCAVSPSAANAGRYMHNGFVLSGLILSAKDIDYEFWEQYRENGYFPVICFGEMLFRNGAYYWNKNIVHHTVLNKCHWEDWGKTDILINLRLFSDYLNGYSFIARRLNNIFKVIPFYIYSFPSIYDVVKSFMLSDNLKGDSSVLFEAVKEQRNKGYLKFSAPLILLLFFSLPLSILISLLKIAITRTVMLVAHKKYMVVHYHKRIDYNLNILRASPVMLELMLLLFPWSK